MATEKIKVALIDDHELLRNGIKQILNSTKNIQVVAEGVDGNNAINIASSKVYDVMIMDIVMPNKNGMDVIRHIKKSRPKTPILVLSMHSESQYAVRSLKLGAAGYLNKKANQEELIKAVEMVAKGKKYISSEVAQILAERCTDEDSAPKHEELSTREFQTMTMIGAGIKLSEIALKLNLSSKTVSVYRSRVKEKMGFKNTSDMINYVIRNGLAPEESTRH